MFKGLCDHNMLTKVVWGLLLLFFLFSGLLISQWNNFHYLFFLLGVGVVWQSGFNLLPQQRLMSFFAFSFFLLVWLSLIVSGHHEKLFGYRFSVILPLLFTPFYFALFNRVSFSIEQIWKLVVLAGLYTVVYDALLFYQNPARGTGLLETPITRGNMGMLFSALALVAVWGVKSKVWKALAIVVFVAGLLLSLKSGSRGGWLSVLTVYLTLLWVKYHFNREQFKQLAWLGVGVGVLIMLLLPHLPLMGRLETTWLNVNKYFMNGDYVSSIGYRFEMWRAAWYGFLEKPFLGWGFNSFDEIFTKFRDLGVVGGSPGHLWGHPHNDYMLLLSEMGIVGFFFAMSILLYPAILFLKGMRQAVLEQSDTMLYLSLTGLVLVEVIMEFMLSDQSFTMRYPFHFYLVLVLLLMTALLKQLKTQTQEM